jgi:hypothetical protein
MVPVAAQHLHGYFNHLVTEDLIPLSLRDLSGIDLPRVRTLIAAYAPATSHALTPALLSAGIFTPPVLAALSPPFTAAQSQARSAFNAARVPVLRGYAVSLMSAPLRPPTHFPPLAALKDANKATLLDLLCRLDPPASLADVLAASPSPPSLAGTKHARDAGVVVPCGSRGAPNPKDFGYCNACGISSVAKAPTLASCATCETPLPDDAKFCGGCGNASPAPAGPPSTCVACNEVIPSTAKFCQRVVCLLSSRSQNNKCPQH